MELLDRAGAAVGCGEGGDTAVVEVDSCSNEGGRTKAG
jgi:hypothetical protein